MRSLINRSKTTPQVVKTQAPVVPAAPKKSLASKAASKAEGWVKAGGKAIQTAKGQLADVQKMGVKAAIQKGTADLKANTRHAKVDLRSGAGMLTPFRSVGGAVYQAATLGGKVKTAAADVRKAVRTRNGSDVATAVRTSAAATSGAIQTAHKSAAAGVLVHKSVAAYRAASNAFKATAPHASKAVVSAAARAAVKNSLAGAKAAAKHPVEAAARLAAQKSGAAVKTFAGSSSRAIIKTASEAAGKAALRAGAKSGASVLAKAAGRFAPGVNVAVAALDVAQAGATLADQKASVGKKAASVITAAGSVVSATNIPLVSQIGAGVSMVSGIVGGIIK
jgi:hypothetical protein